MTQLAAEGERLLAVFREAPDQDLQAVQAARPQQASTSSDPVPVGGTSASGRASESITDSLRTLFPTFQNSRAGNR
eukprot:Seg4847.2 transcript_id=Seg4847.2/GoldUCD/mRNA.D3Y31 product="hypothetical protein" protein_id=Seg4847.2/GoldUCD/D3Y31